MTNMISRPYGGSGFFTPNQQDPGITQVAAEILSQSGPYQLISQRDDGASGELVTSSTRRPAWFNAVGRFRSLLTRQTSIHGGQSEGRALGLMP
jgi:hypothetical protein